MKAMLARVGPNNDIVDLIVFQANGTGYCNQYGFIIVIRSAWQAKIGGCFSRWNRGGCCCVGAGVAELLFSRFQIVEFALVDLGIVRADALIWRGGISIRTMHVIVVIKIVIFVVVRVGDMKQRFGCDFLKEQETEQDTKVRRPTDA